MKTMTWVGLARRNRGRPLAAHIFLGAVIVIGLAGATSAQERTVAIGDIHGDYDAFVGLLRHAGIVDASMKWVARGTTLVQTGDYLDRGPKSHEVIDLLMTLEKQAPKQGGRAVILLGNHEVMNMMGDLRYVTPADFAVFADKNSEKRRQSAFREFLELREARAKALGQIAASVGPEMEKAWMDAHPPGYLEHRAAFGPSGKYGQWLRARPAVVKIGDTIFLHGGISPSLSGLKVEAIRQRVESELRLFDDYQRYLVEQKIILPYFTFDETLAAVQAELDARKATAARKAAEAASAGKKYEPTTEEQQHIRNLENYVGSAAWFMVHPEGPLWFRGYAQWKEEDGAAHVDKVLTTNAAAQIVVAHSPLREGRILSRFGGKVFLIDTGMLSSYFPGGRASALEIQASRFTAVYLDQRAVLLDRSAKAAQPAGQESEEGWESPGGGLAWRLQGQPSAKKSATLADTSAARSATQPDAAPHAEGANRTVLPARVFLGPDGKPLPLQHDEEILEFLKTAKIVEMKNIGEGITHPRKVTLEKDGLRMHAIFRDINVEKDVAQMAGGSVEMFFRDTYIFECAAYQLSRLLGLDNVPPAILRKVHGEDGSLQIWIEKSMTEGERLKEKIAPPDVTAWNRQVQVMRIFDNLVYNIDRNLGNVLIGPDWKLWMIDHTRTFRRHTVLKDPRLVIQCERHLWERLKSFDDAAARIALKPYLRGGEIDGLLKRRQKLVELIQQLINASGEDEVLFTFETAAH